MNQLEILRKLQLASNPTCLPEERAKIGKELFKHLPPVHQNGNQHLSEMNAGVRMLVRTLYYELATIAPERLVDHFPLFAIACGQRSKDVKLAAIDKNLIR
jgi:hypothetical protein